MKKRIIEIVAIIATVSLMVGCANTTSNEKVEDKRPIENAIITEDEVVNPEDNWVDNGNSNAILEEKDDCFVYSIADSSTLNTNLTSLYINVDPSNALITFSSEESFDKYVVFTFTA